MLAGMQIRTLITVGCSAVQLVACAASSDDAKDHTPPVLYGDSADVEPPSTNLPHVDDDTWALSTPSMGPATIGDDLQRPARVVVPDSYDGTTPMPLIILLHGFTANAAAEDVYIGASRHVNALGYILVLPNGLPNAIGQHYWNATPFCCDLLNSNVDDVSYLKALIGEAKANFNIDENRVYFFGHSNGAFMSYRMACEDSDEVAAIVSLAGSTFKDEVNCHATRPVSVLEIHGNADPLVFYGGTPFYPGALETVKRWATRAGCNMNAGQRLDNMNLDALLPGAETNNYTYTTGCEPGITADLWKIRGGSHLPIPSEAFIPSIVRWMYAHPRVL